MTRRKTPHVWASCMQPRALRLPGGADPQNCRRAALREGRALGEHAEMSSMTTTRFAAGAGTKVPASDTSNKLRRKDSRAGAGAAWSRDTALKVANENAADDDVNDDDGARSLAASALTTTLLPLPLLPTRTACCPRAMTLVSMWRQGAVRAVSTYTAVPPRNGSGSANKPSQRHQSPASLTKYSCKSSLSPAGGSSTAV